MPQHRGPPSQAAAQKTEGWRAQHRRLRRSLKSADRRQTHRAVRRTRRAVLRYSSAALCVPQQVRNYGTGLRVWRIARGLGYAESGCETSTSSKSDRLASASGSATFTRPTDTPLVTVAAAGRGGARAKASEGITAGGITCETCSLSPEYKPLWAPLPVKSSVLRTSLMIRSKRMPARREGTAEAGNIRFRCSER